MASRIALLVAAFAVAAAPGVAQTAPPGFPGQLLPTGTTPYWITAVDLNADGFTDLAIPNYDSGSVTVYLRAGASGFAAPAFYPVGGAAYSAPAAVDAADLNGDGLLDLVTSNVASKDVSVLLATAPGTFGAAVNVAVGGMFPSPDGVATGDVNGDGKADVVAANAGPDTILVFLGNGAGSLGAPTSYAAGSDPWTVRLADVTGDGKLDAIVSNLGTSQLSVLTGGTHGTFGAPASISLGPGTFAQAVAASDLDGDGDVDLVGSLYTALSVLLNGGTGSFAAPQQYSVHTGPWSIAVGDLNQDGKLDLATTAWIGEAEVLLGNGNGTFGTAKAFLSGSAPTGIAIAELTGDGNPDVAVTTGYAAAVTLLPGVGDGTLLAPAKINATAAAVAVAFTDLDADGRIDLVAGCDIIPVGFGALVTRLGDGHGSFSPGQKLNTGVPATSVAVADLNGDGSVDVAMTIDGSTPGGPGFTHATQIYLQAPATHLLSLGSSYSSTGALASVAAGDVNGDGFPDLAVAGPGANAAQILVNAGNGVFVAGPAVNVGNAPAAVLFADPNGDGSLDLLAANAVSNDVTANLGNGGSGFAPPVSFPMLASALGLAAADVNGDGLPDLAVGTAGAGVAILLAAPGPLFGPASIVPAVGSIAGLAIAELDGDGKLDIAAAGSSPARVSILHGSGTGGFVVGGTYVGGSFPRSVAAADAMGDGQIDLAIGAKDSSVVLLGNLTFTLGLEPFGTGTPGCSGTQTLFGSGIPKLGNGSFALRTTYGPPTSLELALLGNAASLAGLDPFTIGVLLHVDPMASTFLTALDVFSDGVGLGTGPCPIPNNPLLLGTPFYAQVISLWPSTSCALPPFGLSSTRGLKIVVQ